MAQPAYAIKYLGSMRVSKNTPYLSADILTSFPLTTVAKLSTDTVGDTIGISINNTVMAHYFDGEQQYIEAGQTFQFNKDCTIKLGIYKAVV